jgi:hypothetical protein
MVHRRVVVLQGCRRVYIGSDPCCGVLKRGVLGEAMCTEKSLANEIRLFFKLERICQKDKFKI